jgi:RNA polymerase sigma-70 factor (ECF subfamily)
MRKSLVERIIAGDSQSVVELYALYSPRILNYLTKRLPTAEDAQEILNDVFLDAIDTISMLRTSKNLQAWLYQIAHHKTVDFYRKRKIRSIILSQIPYLEIVDAQVHQPEFQFEKDKVRDKIESAFKSLPEVYRKILKLHYEDKISVKEIAIILALSFKATESLLFRARQSFKLAYQNAL